MSTCCVCLEKFEGEDAPILMMDPSGSPLVLCPQCAEIVDAIAGTPDSPEREEAIARLAEIDVTDPLVATELSKLVSYEDAPLEEEGWENEDDLAEAAPPNPQTSHGGSALYLYLGLGCLAVALVLYILLKLLG